MVGRGVRWVGDARGRGTGVDRQMEGKVANEKKLGNGREGLV